MMPLEAWLNSRFFFGLLAALLILGVATQPASRASSITREHPESSGRLRFPEGVWVGDLHLGGLYQDEARARLERLALEHFFPPLPLDLDGQTLFLSPTQVHLQVDLDGVLTRAGTAGQEALLRRAIFLPLSLGGEGTGADFVGPRQVVIPLEASVDESLVRAFLEGIAARWDTPPAPTRLIEITGTQDLLSLSIPAYRQEEGIPVPAFLAACPGRQLDIEQAIPLVVRALREGDRRPLRLPVRSIPAPRPDLRLLEEALAREAQGFAGVVGVYVRNLRTGEEAGLNADVAFSGASVVKIAIMVLTYRDLADIPSSVARDLWDMMVYSDNDAANRLLALAGRGDGIRGAHEMTALMRDLGLEQSILCSPYGDPGRGWCPDVPVTVFRATGVPAAVTEADPDLRTTPREMGLLLGAIHECANGRGPLVQRFAQQIEPRECQEMVALMGQNADKERLVAGLPQGVEAAHKSGWIPDMKADAGIVFAPSGPYVVSIFVWKGGALSDTEGNRWIARLSWLVYSFFNPLETVPAPAEPASALGSPSG